MKPINVLVASFLVFAPLLTSCGKTQQVTSGDDNGPRGFSLVGDSSDYEKRQQIDWRKEIVYFVMIDRFANGDPSNDAAGNPESHVLYKAEEGNSDALKTYQGGDFQGLYEKLPYIKDLGVTAIWLSPVYDNADSSFFGEFPYHGYHATDFYGVENHFGTLAQLKKVSDKAHELGLKVILDIVNNHTGREHPFVADPKLWRDQQFNKWFNLHDDEGGYTSIQNYMDRYEVENKELAGLPDLKQSNPHVYDYLLDVSKYWITELNLDGFRLDTVRHINKDYWKRYNKDIKDFAGSGFLLLGEVFNDVRWYLETYKGLGFDSLFDFPMKNSVVNAFANGGSMTELTLGVQTTFDLFNKNEIPALFIDNHDLKRFSSIAQSQSAEYWDSNRPIKMALTFINSINGMPFLNYGTEISLAGGEEYTPGLNRRMMDFKAAEEQRKENGLVEFTSKLNKLRSENPALYSGQFKELYKDKDTYVFAKITDDQIALVTFNRLQNFRILNLKTEDGFLSKDATSAFTGKLLGKLSGSEFTMAGDVAKFKLSSKGADIFVLENKFGYAMPDINAYAVDASEYVEGSGSTESEVITVGGKVVEKNPIRKVVFRFTPPKTNIKFSKVVIRGDFDKNSWTNTGEEKRTLALIDEDKGIYEITLELRPGKNFYKFVLLNENGGVLFDDECKKLKSALDDASCWLLDPSKPQEKDRGGNTNNVITVL